MPSEPEPTDYSGSSATQLLVLSWRQLRQDKELLVFPVFGTISANLVGLGVVGVLWALGFVSPQNIESSNGLSTSVYLTGFLVAYASAFVAIYFQVALCAGAMARMDGEDPNILSCLRVAAERLPQIAMWALIATTVGFVLRLIAERVGFLGKLVVAGLSVAWAVATLFVIPIIVADKDGSIAAVGKSKSLVLKNWKNVGSAGLRFGYSFILMPVIVCAAVIVFGVGMAVRYDAPVFYTLGLAGAVGLVGIAVVASAAGMYLRAALYRYAVGLPTPGIPSGILAHSIPGGANPLPAPPATENPGSDRSQPDEGSKSR